jgi:acetyl esterase/lipase
MNRIGTSLRTASLLLLSTTSFAPAHASPAAGEPVAHVYAAPGGLELKAYVFSGPKGSTEQPRPAIVLFHGGGWATGEPQWAFSRARQFAEAGMVAVAAEYRLSNQKGITPLEAMDDARAVIAWTRTHAASLGIDPERIAAYGWSAGGHLAASTAIFDDDGAGERTSSAPNALVLISPAVSLASDGWVQRLLGQRARAKDVSPDEHVRKGLPPTLILQGSDDTVTPLSGAKRFCDRLRLAGNTCELHVYEGFGHLFTPRGIPDDGTPSPDPAVVADAAKRADGFLRSLRFMP